MVFTVPVWVDDATPSRRVLLRGAVGGAAALALGGCDRLGGARPQPAAADPLAELYAGTRSLIRRYELTIAVHATLAVRLKPLLANHRAHLAALAIDMALPTPSGSPQAPPSASADGVPPQPPAALAALLTAEKAGVKAASDACLAVPGWRAPLLGSIAACRASHLDLLT
jgi:hypothetical protein